MSVPDTIRQLAMALNSDGLSVRLYDGTAVWMKKSCVVKAVKQGSLPSA